ncbi:MAG: FtsX-like permease family protein [Kofleriaceae bacterium]
MRWRKLARDLRVAWGRIIVMQLALAVALAGVGIALGARAVLGREIAASYLATRPAEATLELAGPVEAAVLAEVRARPEVAAADARQMLQARVKPKASDPWQMLVVFVAEDFEHLELAKVRPETGAWPPPAGTILVERTALDVMRIGAVDTVLLELAGGATQPVAIAGTVHDAGQAPNWQEHRGCAYATLSTIRALGGPPALHELLVEFRGSESTGDVERAASQLADWLRTRGHAVHEIRVPTLHQHPHQALMNAAQIVLFVFMFALFALCSIVIATMLSSILARQTREIGVMKTVGATTAQLAGMYAAFVIALGVVATAIAIPLASAGAHGMIANVGRMMNLAIADAAIPPWVFGALAALGIGIPLAVAAVPILRATRLTVRQSLAQHGAGGDFVRPGLARLPIAIRNALRRPARLAMTMTLLVTGGTMVVSAANLQRGMANISALVEESRGWDIEIRLRAPIDPAPLRDVPGVRTLEGWSATPAALGAIVHTYPDGGHGSFALVAIPPGGSTLAHSPVVAGRWLEPGDSDGVVLGGARAQLGTRVTITVDGNATTFTVIGVVQEIGSSSAFVTDAAYRRVTGTTGSSLLRIATTAATPAERAPILAELERRLAAQHAQVHYAMPTPALRSIIDDHIVLVVRAVIVMAGLLAFVGLLGLASATAINVAERTREIGIMKTIGATGPRIVWIFVAEAMAVAAASSLIAALLALPVTALVGARISLIGAPPFTISYAALVGWPLVVVAGSGLACLLPALRAGRLSVTSTLSEV